MILFYTIQLHECRIASREQLCFGSFKLEHICPSSPGFQLFFFGPKDKWMFWKTVYQEETNISCTGETKFDKHICLYFSVPPWGKWSLNLSSLFFDICNRPFPLKKFEHL